MIFSPLLQRGPVYPGTQVQVNVFMPSWHVAPLKQDPVLQSSISTSLD